MFIVLSLLLISILSGTSIKGRLGSIDRHLSQLSKCCKLWEIMIMRDLLITSLKLKLKPVLYKKRCACLGLQKSIKGLARYNQRSRSCDTLKSIQSCKSILINILMCNIALQHGPLAQKIKLVESSIHIYINNCFIAWRIILSSFNIVWTKSFLYRFNY